MVKQQKTSHSRLIHGETVTQSKASTFLVSSTEKTQVSLLSPTASSSKTVQERPDRWKFVGILPMVHHSRLQD